MPELPEAERARRVLEQHAVGRVIADADDSDSWVCRPHPVGEIAGVVRGLKVVGAGRQGKSLWLDTDAGIALSIHLGMSGSIVPVDPAEETRRADRFTLRFEDGTSLALRDRRRLGRVRLDADRSKLGPDAVQMTQRQFARMLGASKRAVKARLLDQAAIAGVGNLLADEVLWRAKIAPNRPANELTGREVGRLWRSVAAVLEESLVEGNGSGSGEFARHRRLGVCPRCGSMLERGVVGGRTTYWCPREQR
jgi:formamidopyrimidine-DNA glycosylase